MNLEDAALQLDEAALSASPIEPLTKRTSFGRSEGYTIQSLLMERRRARGEVQSGLKMGFTSAATMKQMSVDGPICGQLTTEMELVPGEQTSRRCFIHPRVEPEIVFLLSRSIQSGESPSQVVRAIDAVACGVEVIDSRYVGLEFSMADIVADNASAARYMVGSWHRWPFDISNLGVLLEVDGVVVEIGSTAAILGSPTRALVHAARLAENLGLELQGGDIVLAGAATASVSLEGATDVRATVEKLGQCTVKFL